MAFGTTFLGLVIVALIALFILKTNNEKVEGNCFTMCNFATILLAWVTVEIASLFVRGAAQPVVVVGAGGMRGGGTIRGGGVLDKIMGGGKVSSVANSDEIQGYFGGDSQNNANPSDFGYNVDGNRRIHDRGMHALGSTTPTDNYDSNRHGQMKGDQIGSPLDLGRDVVAHGGSVLSNVGPS